MLRSYVVRWAWYDVIARIVVSWASAFWSL